MSFGSHHRNFSIESRDDMYLNSYEEGLEKEMSFGSHRRNFSIEYTLMFIFLGNYGSIGIHSYEPSGSKAIKMISCLFPLKCGVYESIPMNQLALKEKSYKNHII